MSVRRRPSIATSPDATALTCAGNTLLNTARLCAQAYSTGAVPATSAGTCSSGYIANYAGLCINPSLTGATPPIPASGACASGVLSYEGVCVAPPAAAVGTSPGYGQACTDPTRRRLLGPGNSLRNGFGVCVASTVAGLVATASPPLPFTATCANGWRCASTLGEAWHPGRRRFGGSVPPLSNPQASVCRAQLPKFTSQRTKGRSSPTTTICDNTHACVHVQWVQVFERQPSPSWRTVVRCS